MKHSSVERHAARIIDEALAMPHSAVVGLFSGGHDSATVTHYAASHLGARLAFVAHLDTGIGIPQTREYVREVCKQFGWPLREYRAAENTNAKGESDPQVYEDLVVKHGFPGPFHHRKMFNRLKERGLNRICRDVGANPKAPVIFISGVRREESSRRMRNVDEIQKRGRVIWCAPFTHWTKADCRSYMDEQAIPLNPVVQNLCMSGECLCGAFAGGQGERDELRYFYPEVEAEITRIEQRVLDAGHPWKWHEAPPNWYLKMRSAEKAGQIDAFAAMRDEVLDAQGFAPLCTSCDARFMAGKK